MSDLCQITSRTLNECPMSLDQWPLPETMIPDLFFIEQGE